MKKRLYALLAGLVGLVPTLSLAAEFKCDTSKYVAPQSGLLVGITTVCGACGQCQIPDFFIVGNNVMTIILGLSGSLMLLMVVYGGFLWLTSGGNSTQVEKGKKILLSSLIGLIIVFGAYTAIQFLLEGLGIPAGKGAGAVMEIFGRPYQTAAPTK